MPIFDQIDHAGVTDVGIRRTHNQDAFSEQKATDIEYWRKVGHVFLVADGMGGHAVGEKASAKAAQEIPLTYAKHAHEGPLVAIRRSFQEANSGIYGIGLTHPEFRGLGTTATALILREEGAWIGHVGDSRAYRIRGGKIEQLTFDHSYAWEMARRLNIPPEELSDVKKNVIVRSLGPDSSVQVDVEGPHPVHAGDVFILCSDGLTNMVSPEEIGTVVSALPAQESARFLIELANLRGGPDNITIIVVRLGGEEASTVKIDLLPEKRWKLWLKRSWQAWHRNVPLPITLLGSGLLLAVFGILLAYGDAYGIAGVLLVLAIAAIIAGFIGLYLHGKKHQENEANEPDAERQLNIYREHSCRIERNIVEKLMKMEGHLKEQLDGASVSANWDDYRALHEGALRSLHEGDLLAAFRDQCRALMGLARTLNKSRHKEEGFRPKWES